MYLFSYLLGVEAIKTQKSLSFLLRLLLLYKFAVYYSETTSKGISTETSLCSLATAV